MLKRLWFLNKSEKKKDSSVTGNMNVTIAEYNGKKFVSGLIWKTIENPRTVMKEARLYGKSNDMDIVAIRDHPEQTQAGYVKKSYGVTKDMFSLATAVTGILEQNSEEFFHVTHEELQEAYRNDIGWLVVIPIPKESIKKKNLRNSRDDNIVIGKDAENEFSYYLLASSKGVILPQTDKMGDFEYISREANKLISLFHGDKGLKKTFKWILAPENFSIGEKELTLAQLITNDVRLKDYGLKPLTFGLTKKELTYIAIFVIFATSYMGWKAYQKKKADEAEAQWELTQKKIAEQEAERIKKQTGLNVDNRDLIKPWITRPSLHAFLSVCNQRMVSVPPNIAGWNLKGAECNEHNITAVYTRMPLTTVKEFRHEVQRLFSTDPFIEVDGNSGSYSLKNQMPPSGREDVINALEAMSEVTSLFQQLGINYDIKLEEQPVIPPLPGQQKDAPKKSAPWSIYDFSIDTYLFPADIFSGFSVPVIRLDSVVIDSTTKEMKWKVKGKIYVKNEKSE